MRDDSRFGSPSAGDEAQIELSCGREVHTTTGKSHIDCQVTSAGGPARLRPLDGDAGFAVIVNPHTGKLAPARIYEITATALEVADHAGHELDDIPNTDLPTRWEGASIG